ncbi:MAG: DUF3168 domain-containing protein [Patulibacter sp.]|nr:DUF3168 domain-containing protein [Patulibacter sp.]
MTIPQSVSKRPSLAVQRAIVALLKADSALTTLLTGTKVYDGDAPEATPQPYVIVGDHLSTDSGDLTSFGREILSTIHVWTKTRSNVAGEDIANRINQLLDRQHRSLAIVGHRAVYVRLEFDQALGDPDPQLRHHVLRYRIETAQLA